MLRTLALLALGFLLALPATGQITFEPLPTPAEDEAPEAPIINRPVRVTLDVPADTVTVTWRPNSAIPEVVTLDVSGTSFEWTPTRSGVARIDVISAGATTSQNVSVRYDNYPASGIFILIIAGTILFGGAGFAMGKLLGGEMPKEGYQMPMDT